MSEFTRVKSELIHISLPIEITLGYTKEKISFKGYKKKMSWQKKK